MMENSQIIDLYLYYKKMSHELEILINNNLEYF